MCVWRLASGSERNEPTSHRITAVFAKTLEVTSNVCKKKCGRVMFVEQHRYVSLVLFCIFSKAILSSGGRWPTDFSFSWSDMSMCRVWCCVPFWWFRPHGGPKLGRLELLSFFQPRQVGLETWLSVNHVLLTVCSTNVAQIFDITFLVYFFFKIFATSQNGQSLINSKRARGVVLMLMLNIVHKTA